jgi:hypothetical protein
MLSFEYYLHYLSTIPTFSTLDKIKLTFQMQVLGKPIHPLSVIGSPFMNRGHSVPLDSKPSESNKSTSIKLDLYVLDKNGFAKPRSSEILELNLFSPIDAWIKKKVFFFVEGFNYFLIFLLVFLEIML